MADDPILHRIFERLGGIDAKLESGSRRHADWFFKATAMDKVIGPAFGYRWTTDPISGETAVIAGIVVSGMFFSGIANIIKR